MGTYIHGFWRRASKLRDVDQKRENRRDRSWVAWTHHQGPGRVDFAESEITVDKADGMATTTASFTEPGDYLIRVQAIDNTAAFEFHCCWTNGYVPVRVVP